MLAPAQLAELCEPSSQATGLSLLPAQRRPAFHWLFGRGNVQFGGGPVFLQDARVRVAFQRGEHLSLREQHEDVGLLPRWRLDWTAQETSINMNRNGKST